MIDSLLIPIVESAYLNRDMCKFESSQKDKTDGSRLIPRKHTETLVLLRIFHNSLLRHDVKSLKQLHTSIHLHSDSASIFLTISILIKIAPEMHLCRWLSASILWVYVLESCMGQVNAHPQVAGTCICEAVAGTRWVMRASWPWCKVGAG